jgi:hypothetical protein
MALLYSLDLLSFAQKDDGQDCSVVVHSVAKTIKFWPVAKPQMHDAARLAAQPVLRNARFSSNCRVADHMLGGMEENAVEVGSG